MSAPARSRTQARRGRAGVGVAVLAVGTLATAALSGCGVPLDDEPRAIVRTTSTPVDATPTTTSTPGGQEVTVYFVSEARLEGVPYPVKGEPSLSQALGYALETPAQGAPSDLVTAVPPGTKIRKVEVRDGLARIDLTGEMNDISGENQKQAFAQLVFTALAFPGVSRVRFLIDGKGVDAPTDEGNLATVSASDYDPPLNPR